MTVIKELPSMVRRLPNFFNAQVPNGLAKAPPRGQAPNIIPPQNSEKLSRKSSYKSHKNVTILSVLNSRILTSDKAECLNKFRGKNAVKYVRSIARRSTNVKVRKMRTLHVITKRQ